MLLDDIEETLADNNLGTFGTDLFTGYMPDKPDNLICLFEYGGSPPDIASDVDEENPSFQVRVRNTNYLAARTKIESIVNVLHRIANKTINDSFYLSIFANQSPASIGRDANNRAEIVVNFRVTKRR